MAKAFKPSILTANDLLSGDVVFWTGARWAQSPASAYIAEDPQDAEALAALGAGQPGAVVGAYLVEIKRGPHGPAPLHYREQIRISGPTAGSTDYARAA